MNWCETKNTHPVKVKDIPLYTLEKGQDGVIAALKKGGRVLAFFGRTVTEGVEILVAVGSDKEKVIRLVRLSLPKGSKSYPAFTLKHSPLHMYEREFWEDFGIVPQGHPWLKPVRYAANRKIKNKLPHHDFFKIDGPAIHQVGVGPIHAGVIEPGHFRFLCHGETVFHLEIQLGYQHRGVEDLFIEHARARFGIHLAESIAGDTTVAHAMAYAQAMEGLADIKVSPRAHIIRTLALELERAAIHTGDLGALAGDVAYLPGASIYGGTRTHLINTSQDICGNRFGKGLIRVGGVVFDLDAAKIAKARKALTKVKEDVRVLTNMMLSSTSVLSRLEKTGVVTEAQARESGLVGFSARMTGVPIDARVQYPFGAYDLRSLKKDIGCQKTGDVVARTRLRYNEIMESLTICFELLNLLEDKGNSKGPLMAKPSSMAKDSFVISMTEGWRGEVVHAAFTDGQGNLSRYKVKDPSFHNWFGLALSLRNEDISDFPLCNKSFNLSYCGNDL